MQVLAPRKFVTKYAKKTPSPNQQLSISPCLPGPKFVERPPHPTKPAFSLDGMLFGSACRYQ